MRRRIFIAINLPEEIKRNLATYQGKIEELLVSHRPAFSRAGAGMVRWTKKENLHITLVFIGYLNDEELFETCKTTKEVASRNSPFLINLNKICYGPPKKMPPRMIWTTGEKSKEFALLKDDLEKSLIGSEKIRFSPENRALSVHITLGRISAWEFRQIEPEERPEVEEEISLSFEANSIEVMESQLKKRGPEYTILESAQLGKQ